MKGSIKKQINALSYIALMYSATSKTSIAFIIGHEIWFGEKLRRVNEITKELIKIYQYGYEAGWNTMESTYN